MLAALAVLVVATTPWPELSRELFAAMDSATRRVSREMGGYAMQSSVVTAEGSVHAAAGSSDPYPGKPDPRPSEVGDGFLVGSVTKMATSAAVLRLVEAGSVRLDDRMAPLIDPYLVARNHSTLFELWRDDRINAVTVRQLLAMTSGIAEFDTYALRVIQLRLAPRYDITPYDILRYVNKSFFADPGREALYSSTNYELLGLLLASKAGASDWDTYDQGSVLPVRPGAEYRNVTFAVRGTLESYGRADWTINHGYPLYRNRSDVVWNVSATSGWTCGNMLTSTPCIAQFTYDLFGPEHRVLPARFVRLMYDDTRPLHNFPVPNYGLGAMYMTPSDDPSGWVIGHIGGTYGFSSYAGHNMNYSYTLVVCTNAESELGTEELFSELIDTVSSILGSN